MILAGDRVTIKRATLLQLEELLGRGDSVAALEVVRECLDVGRQAELQRCKNLVYLAFRQGRLTYEEYRKRWEYTDGFLR